MSELSHDAETKEEVISEIRISKKGFEIFVYLVLFLLNAFYFKEALGLPGSARGVGAGGFPLLVSLLIGASLLALLVVSLVTARKDEVEPFVAINRPVQVALTIAVLLAMVLSLPWTGPLVGIALLALLLMWLGGERRYLLLLGLPPLLSVGIYVLFVLVLGVYFE
ncbi:tripartite tricarboxylate transporter TctB family protein [Halomonas sp. LR3S48]|uniref:tripartite tricarboxylate transporter TctB family protein n=1 Tax=Halomonas sp. LR3S48 TaxID=2982694 RepID=UPI0021E48C3B|nr:tripartite tricarboxylate transporter TctB family protein [Halomonas sp. LR3S48]UYG03363.1 tripartite tricarboxylate transporter TctB family protein [Halomonas sp. LR3S48]